MGVLLSPAALTREVMALGSGQFLADPFALIEAKLELFRPPETISTVDWAERYRKFRLPDGGALVPYDRWRTPYNIAPQDALDEPGVELVVMPKPSRSGGTAIAENHLGKLIHFGPMVDIGWYLGSDKAVKEYAERVIRPLFEDHEFLAAKVGKAKQDDTDARKRVAGQLIEWLAANDAGFRNREFGFMVMDEPDGWTKYSESPEVQFRGRTKNLGRRRKGIILSHPDKGWRAGVAAAWESSSRGIYIMRCPDCRSFAAAHATKHWPGVPEFQLTYVKPKDPNASADERIAMAERTAGMACPDCGAVHGDAARFAMIDEAGREGWWMHRGQVLDPVRGIQGAPEPHTKRGFWIHGLMVKVSPAAELARGLEEALIKYERSGGSRTATKVLREFMSKQLGEIFEGKAGIEGLTAAKLKSRAEAEPKATMGMFPPQARFIVGAVDVGAGKFDLSFRAFDIEARSWWLDRRTIRQRMWPDGSMRDIRTRERIEDWDVLVDQAILRLFPIEGRENWAMPVAAVAIDASDGNVTWMAREFARRCQLAGHAWGKWPRVKLIQGSPSLKTSELPLKPREINRDDAGKPLVPSVFEYTLGVHKLKEIVLDRLAVEDEGPGQCWFAPGIATNHFDELFNEPLIDGKFERQGPNESFDLFAYEEAMRLMLAPDRKDYRWDQSRMPEGEVWTEEKLPPWARPVPLHAEGGDHAAPGTGESAKPKRASLFDKYETMQRRTRRPDG